MIRSKNEIIKDNFTTNKEDYIEWKIHNWKILQNENEKLKSPNFRIGNLIWYFFENIYKITNNSYIILILFFFLFLFLFLFFIFYFFANYLYFFILIILNELP